MSTDYEKFYQQNLNGLGKPTKEFVDFFKSFNKKELVVLDIGCGQGRDALFIGRLGHRVTAVDISPTGINQLKANSKKEELSIETVVMDIRKFIPNKKYDVLLIDRTLHMLKSEEQIKVLKNLLKHLTKNAFVLIADEKKNLPVFKKILKETGVNWEIFLEKRGFLFVKESRI